MAKILKKPPLFLALAAFLTLSFQVHAIPMFEGGARDPRNSSANAPAESIEQQRRRTSDFGDNAHLDEEGSSRQTRGTARDAVDSSIQDEEVEHKADELNLSNGGNSSQFGDAVANCGSDPLAPEVSFPEKLEKLLSLEKFRAAAADPDFANVERLIIDSENSFIRPHNKGTDSKTRGKNETIIAALKAALQKEFPRFSPTLIERIVEEELPHSNMWSMFEKLQGKPDLSTEALQHILEKADNLMLEQEFAEEHSFTLQHFRNALAHPDNHEAERLIISGQGASAMIVAQAGSSHAADAIIRKTLKRALENEGHRRDFVHQLTSEVLPYSSVFARTLKTRVPLSFEKLKSIIQRADDAMAEIKLLQATRSIAPLSATATNRAGARALLRSGIEQFFSRLGIQNEPLAATLSAAAVPKSPEELAAEHAAAAQEAAWEQSEMEKIFRSVICRGRNADALKEHYREAEAATIAAEAAYNQAMEARWHAENKAKYLQEARGFFEKVKAALDEKRELAEFDESTLSKISQGADLTGAILGIIDASGLTSLKNITDAISTFATFADHRLTIAEAQKAYKELQTAIQKAEAAIEGHEQVEEAATMMQAHADEMERLKKQDAHDKTIRLLDLVRLPNDAGDMALRQWATELACESDPANENDATITAHLLYKQAKKNPAQIHELASRLWGERVALLEQELQRLAEETPSDAEYQNAQQKEIETRTTALVAKVTLEGAAQIQSEWLSKRDQLREQKKFLEDQLRSDPEHRAERQAELEEKRRELSTHQTQQESINSTYHTAAAAAKRLTLVAAKAHADAFEKFKIFTAVKQLHARNTTRLQAAVDADQKILDEILVEEAKWKVPLAREAKVRAVKTRLRDALAQQEIAFKQGDKKIADLYSQIVEALGGDIFDDSGATYAYQWALREEDKGNTEAVETWLKCAQAYEEQAAALLQQIEALVRGDNEIIKLHKERSNALKGAAISYSKTAEAQTKRNREAAKNYRKEAQACEALAAALAQQIEALMRKDKKAVKLHMLKREAWSKVLSAYAWANVEQSKGNSEATAAWRKKAQTREIAVAALERQTEALEQKDEDADTSNATDTQKTKASSSSQQKKSTDDSSTSGQKGNGNCSIS